MKKLSIVGRDYHTDENVVGYYNTGDRMKYWGEEAGVNGSETLQGAGLRKDERLAGGQELISEDQDSTLH